MNREGLWRAYLETIGLSGLFVLWLVSSAAQADDVAKSPYGPDDEIGVLNELTEANTLAVLQRVSSGKTYDLSVENFVGMPGLADLGMGDPPFHMWLTHTPRGMRVEQLSPAGGPPNLALYDKDRVHVYLFAERGVCLLELLWLEDLAKDRIYEFAFIAAPIKMRGATGSPVRPLALPIRAESSQ